MISGAVMSLVKLALIDFGIQWVGWAVAATFKTEKFYDLAGEITFKFQCFKYHNYSNHYTNIVILFQVR